MIFVLCPYEIDTGLISKACSLGSGTEIHALVPVKNALDAAQHGADLVHTVSSIPEDESSFALWLKQLLERWNCEIVLAPATIQMRSVMPMLAWYMKAGLTADCTDLTLTNGRLIQTRPAFGNSLIANIQTQSTIQMATVRPGTFPSVKVSAIKYEVIPEEIVCNSRIQLLNSVPFQDGKPLSQAQIIIAGGQGIGSKEGFDKLERLANRIGASVAASRNAVDAGYAPYRSQVGMTGVTVCPKIYIAIGISGAVQHLAGMSGSETVIAINSDPKAPIFDYADYGIVADWQTVIDKLMEELL